LPSDSLSASLSQSRQEKSDDRKTDRSFPEISARGEEVLNQHISGFSAARQSLAPTVTSEVLSAPLAAAPATTIATPEPIAGVSTIPVHQEFAFMSEHASNGAIQSLPHIHTTLYDPVTLAPSFISDDVTDSFTSSIPDADGYQPRALSPHVSNGAILSTPTASQYTSDGNAQLMPTILLPIQPEFINPTFSRSRVDRSAFGSPMATQPPQIEPPLPDVMQNGTPTADTVQNEGASITQSSTASITTGYAHSVETVPVIAQHDIPVSVGSVIGSRLLKRFDKRRLATLGNIAFYLMLALLVLAAFSFAVSDNPNKSFFGFRWYWIQTGSMDPELPIGTLAIVKVIEPSRIKEGDDVTFRLDGGGDDQFVTHRIVEVIQPDATNSEVSFVTKGIANSSNDPEPRSADSAIGKVILGIPFLGNAMAALRANIVPVGTVIVSLLGVYYILGRKIAKSDETEVYVKQ
jgi:signal peptidase